MKTILFVTESGSGKGLGHLSRCLALSQAFESRGYTAEFVLWGGSREASLLRNRKVSLFNWTENPAGLPDLASKADCLILDSYTINEKGVRRITEDFGPGVYLDDTNRMDYPDGTVVNWNLFADDLNYRERSGLSYLLGPGYIALRKPFWSVPAKPITDDVKSVMISFGGDDSKQMTPRIIDYLNREYPALVQYVVIGPNYRLFQSIKSCSDRKIKYVLAPEAEDMKEIMLKSDIAITSGGQILNELGRVGVPTIAVSVADNQSRNILAWEKAGCLKNAGNWSDSNLMTNLDRQFQGLHDKQKRIRFSRTGRCLIPHNGAEHIIDFLEKKTEGS